MSEPKKNNSPILPSTFYRLNGDLLQNLCARSRAAPNAIGVNQSIGLQLATLTFKNQLIEAHSCLRYAVRQRICVALERRAIVFLRIIVCRLFSHSTVAE